MKRLGQSLKNKNKNMFFLLSFANHLVTPEIFLVTPYSCLNLLYEQEIVKMSYILHKNQANSIR